MFPIPVSKTKIIPPRRRPELLARKRLLDALFEALDKKLVLISAPAGYGKTSLMIDAVQQSEYPCCWLSLDELDRDPLRFLSYLLASISERFNGVGAQTASMMKNLTSFEDAMERLAVTLVNEAYEGIHEHFVLILDDYHILEGVQPINDFLNRFIQLADDSCHIIIASRTLTTLGDLPLMVAREQVGGFSFADLAFRVDEVQALILQNQKVHISDEEAQNLVKESEGWITGLQFSGLGVYNRERNVESKTGVGLFEYLGQQVVDRQTPELREFLLRTSLTEEFDAALCEAVLAPFYDTKQDWDGFIRTILKNNLFALPVGTDGTSLRYHHLFRDYLRQRMKRERSDEVKQILKRLAHAYETSEEWEKAYATIQELEDLDALIELIDLASFNNLQNTARLVENWVRDLPPSVLKNNARILSVTGTLKLIRGDYRSGVENLERAMESFRKDGDISQLALTLMRHSFGLLYLGDYKGAVRDLDEAIALIEDRDELQSLYADVLHTKGSCLRRLGQNRAALKCQEEAIDIAIRIHAEKKMPEFIADIGILYQAMGDYSEAERAYLKVLDIWKREGNLWAQAGMLNNMGYMFHQNGSYEKAAATFEEGLLCARRSGHTRTETLILIGLGDLYAEVQDFEISAQNYDLAKQMLMEREDFFLLFSLLIGRGNLFLLQKDFSAARDLIHEVEMSMQTNESHYENGYFSLLLGKFHLLQNNPASAVTSLENAASHFVQEKLALEAISSHIWLAASYMAGKRKNEAVATIRQLGQGRPDHIALIAAIQCRPWLEALQRDAEVGRIVRDILSRAEKLASRLPDARRELRRRTRVVNVPTAKLSIKGFGHARVELDGRELNSSDWQTQSVRDLFFFFLSQPKPLTKEQVAEQFWHELYEPSRVRLRFKNEMYRLRRAVGNEVIRFENPMYSFNRALNYEYDVEAFESYCARAKAAQTNLERIELYRKAVDLVQGPYLNDIYFDGIIADREHLDQIYLAALVTLAELYLKEAQPDEALTMGLRVVDYKPEHEAGYRLLMMIHHRRGDRAAVKRAYEACKTALQKHLSLPPSQETEELYRKLIS